MEGPWNSHAFFTQSLDTSRQPRVSFTFWASRAELGGASKGMLEVVMKRGNTVLATTDPREASSAAPIPKTELLKLPNGQVFLVEHLAKMAGPFTVELRHGSRVIKTFYGQIANGAFVPHALSTLPASDPLHFLSPRAMSSDGGVVTSELFSWVTSRGVSLRD